MAATATATFTFPPRSLWPIGFGFRPTEEELINHYLKNKILGHESLVKYIHEIDLYKYEPWELPAKSFFESDNFEWFFFRAYTSKPKRSTATGCWRTTGDDRPIKARGTNKVIATRKILVFYRGRSANAVKTNWVIHEYHLHPDTNIPFQRPFVICRLKENAEEKDFSICDRDEQNSTVAHLKKKGTQRETQEMNRDAQANGQSVLQPLWNSTRQPALTDFQFADGEVNMQTIQPGASENEDNLTEVLKSILLPDEYLDDATSNMCRSPWRSQSEPALMDFQPANVNDGEVNNQLSQAEAFESELNLYEHLMNSVFGEDENCNEVTSNNRIDSYNFNKEELDSMVFELQSGGFSSDTDTDTAFGLPNNHFSSSWIHKYGSSAEQNMSTIKKSRSRPLPTVKRVQYKEGKYELQGSFSVLSGEGEARTCDISMDSDNPDPGPKTFKAQRQPKSSNVVPYGSEPKRDRSKREIRSKAMSQYKAKEDEERIEIVHSPQLSMTDSNSGLKSEAGNKATKSGISYCGSIGSTNSRFSYILTTKCIHHNSSLPLVYVAKAFLGIVMFVMFAQEVLLYGHRC